MAPVVLQRIIACSINKLTSSAVPQRERSLRETLLIRRTYTQASLTQAVDTFPVCDERETFGCDADDSDVYSHDEDMHQIVETIVGDDDDDDEVDGAAWARYDRDDALQQSMECSWSPSSHSDSHSDPRCDWSAWPSTFDWQRPQSSSSPSRAPIAASSLKRGIACVYNSAQTMCHDDTDLIHGNASDDSHATSLFTSHKRLRTVEVMM